MVEKNNKVTLNNVRLSFPNFAGRTDQYNKTGVRKFHVQLEEDTAEAMLADGFNVKWPNKTVDENGDPTGYSPTLEVTVSKDHDLIPPFIRIFVVDGDAEQRLDLSNIDIVDEMDIDHVDVIFSVYDWEVNGNSGRKPYLQSLRIFLRDYSFGESTY